MGEVVIVLITGEVYAGVIDRFDDVEQYVSFHDSDKHSYLSIEYNQVLSITRVSGGCLL